jgi:hypothetical protein
MKLNLIKSAFAAVAGLALCAPVALHAQTNTTAAPLATASSTKASKVTKIEYKGTVKSIDTAANTITVTCKKGDMTFMVIPTTKITNSKKPATLADIMMGEKVTGSYTKDAAGTMTACKINGHPAMAAAPAAASTNAAPVAK